MSEQTTGGKTCDICGQFVPFDAPHSCGPVAAGEDARTWQHTWSIWSVPVPDPDNPRIADLEAAARTVVNEWVIYTSGPQQRPQAGLCEAIGKLAALVGRDLGSQGSRP